MAIPLFFFYLLPFSFSLLPIKSCTMILKKTIISHWQIILVALLAAVFFAGTSLYNRSTQTYGQLSADKIKSLDFVKWSSPDETANYIFAKLYAQKGGLSIREDFNLYVKDIILPRSFRSDAGVLKPVSFLGIILIYGKIGQVFGYRVIPYLTPFFASIGLVFFYLLLRRIFNKDNALLSTFLLASFPPYIYYSARSMFHNVLFAVLLIIAFYFSYLMAEKRKEKLDFLDLKLGNQDYRGMIAASLAGLFLGSALIVRTSELIWLGPLFLFLWLFNITKISLTRMLLFLGFLILAFLPVFYYNQILYGSPFKGGYNEMNQSIAKISQASTDLVGKAGGKIANPGQRFFNTVKDVVFHFGIHPRTSLDMADKYFMKMFAWLFWLSIFGILAFLLRYKKIRKRQMLFLLAWLLGSFVLIIYYGSWEFHDNPDPNVFTIGNSYTRYWLPAYLGAIPFASLLITHSAWALAAFVKLPRKAEGSSRFLNQLKMRRGFLSRVLGIIAVAVIVFISLSFVMFGSDEGLIASANRQRQNRIQWERILRLTEGDSTIITTYHDKLLFPERKVIVGLFTDLNMVREYAKLAALLPVYYYNFSLSGKDLAYLNNTRLKSVGLQIKKVEQISPDFTLYKLFTLPQDL